MIYRCRYAVEGFKVNAVDYLLKPVSYKDFCSAAERALRWFGLLRKGTEKQPEPDGGGKDCIFVKSEHKLVRLRYSDIIYVEGLKDYVKIHTSEYDSPVLSLMTMKALELMLPENMFARVHKSYIVNFTKIGVIERNRIVFGKNRIPVSDSYRDSFYEKLAGYAMIENKKREP